MQIRAGAPWQDVRFGSLADICSAKGHVRFAPNSDRESGFPPKVHDFPQEQQKFQ
jgi:hypothetical protein